jgi:tagaturonate reductase
MQILNKQFIQQEKNLPDQLPYFNADHLPERIVQFGEGNFLRSFIDWMIHETNKQGLFNGRIVVVQPIPFGNILSKLNEQDGLYTLVMQGVEENQGIEKYEVISSISRGINPYEDWAEVLKVAESPLVEFVFSNTTEAGIAYLKEDFDLNNAPQSYPGKLTAFLYHRFCVMEGKPEAGMTIIPCELIENNGKTLKEIVNKIAKDWSLPDSFVVWLNHHNRFCNTLVDRIVPGYPKDNIGDYQFKLGYEDQLLTIGELYHLFVIDSGSNETELIPFQKAGLNVKWEDVTPYRQLKVSLLNAPHTMMFSIGYLSGENTVFEFMEDEALQKFVTQSIFSEIIPILPFDEEYKNEFAVQVINRFKNPFFKHQLTDIGLNGFSKYKARVLPLLLKWVHEKGKLPNRMIFSLAALFFYFKPIQRANGSLLGIRQDSEYQIRDNDEILDLFEEAWKEYDGSIESVKSLVSTILSDERAAFGYNLLEIEGLHELLSNYLNSILINGMKSSLKLCDQI